MITIKSKSDSQKMREGGKILAHTFEMIAKNIKVGVTAKELDRIAYETIVGKGAQPSFLGYSGYEYTTCISKNEEIVHGIPYENKELLPGDICCIDIGVYYKGFHVDAARPFLIEPVDDQVAHLAKVTEESFFLGIKEGVPGAHLGDISSAIQAHVEKNDLTVVKDLYSHGIGKELHEEPLIPNYGEKGKGVKLKPGMTFAIEPMVNLGVADILTLDDKWTIITADRKWSAHYENTVLITENGPEVLTIY
ncbi:type I methionyl aminopeptidase [Candidatus Marinamargulisbacteria bacterium SCGC AG-439-L15]|nr:type I methionyl aminopeptidase [Candidatus Marinamargulisbacteria bacterium SCGC AG-439-L15]